MEKIPFDIKYRPEIEAGKYLVVTRGGDAARIICWDRKGYYHIIALLGREPEVAYEYTEKGAYVDMAESDLDLFLVVNPDYKEPAAEPSADSEKDKIVPAIEWTGSNLKEVIEFTGKSPRFEEWFKSWDEFESYVHSHGDILKLFSEDGSHFEVPVGAWIVKTPDGHNVPSIAKYIQKEQPEVELFECPKTPIKDAIEVTSRMKYIDEELKPIAEFIMLYASWNLHKSEWNQPTIEVPLFRALDALIQKGKPYCEA